MNRLQPLRSSNSRSSIAGSDTTYHSFHDIELYEPASPPKKADSMKGEAAYRSLAAVQSQYSKENQPPQARPSTEMRRQDSGYESLPRNSTSSWGGKRRTSTGSSNGSSSGGYGTQQSQHPPLQPSRSRPQSRPGSKGRPVIRRSAKTCPYPVRPGTSTGQAQALYSARSHPFHQFPYLRHYHQQQYQSTEQPQQPDSTQPQSGFFHFPVHPQDLRQQQTDAASPQRASMSTVPRDMPSSFQHPRLELEPEHPAASEVAPPRPQSTHYWTSDRTRRLEYAAIDAAHRGIKGWARRHLVPDCIMPKEKARVAFDDDSGSVRRYRLELDEEDIGGRKGSPTSASAMKDEKKLSTWARIKSW